MGSSIREKFIGNTSWMTGQKIYSMLISLIVGALSARYLGPSNYGLLNYGAAIISFFLTISALGMDSLFVAEMIKKPEKQGSYIGTTVIMRFIVSVFSLALIWGIVLILEPDNQLLQIVTVLQATVVVLNTYEVFLYWFQMNLEMKYVSIATMIAITAAGIWRIVLLATGQSVVLFALTGSLSSLLTGMVVVFFFFKKHHPKVSIVFDDGKYLLSNSYHFIISGVAIALYSQLDRVMLGKFVSDEAVGYYSAAAAIVTMWEFVPAALINSARPILMKKMKEDYNGYIYLYKTLLLTINILGLVVGIAVLCLGRFAILVLYGTQYLEAVPAMSILIWSTSFAILGTARSIWIVAEGKNKYTKYYVFIGAGVNTVLNAIFIPIWGITAAAATTLVSQIVVAIIAPLFFKETRDFTRLYFESFQNYKHLFKLIKEAVARRTTK